MKLKRLIYGGLGAAVLCFMSVECVLRYRGYGDFPIYNVDSQIGYVPAPSQAGLFAGTFPWYFNEHSMRNQPFVSDADHGVLLLGDSIVFGGGIDFMPEERLGACLQAAAGGSYRGLSAAAGSLYYDNDQVRPRQSALRDAGWTLS